MGLVTSQSKGKAWFIIAKEQKGSSSHLGVGDKRDADVHPLGVALGDGPRAGQSAAAGRGAEPA